jgi:hypothetical protein
METGGGSGVHTCKREESEKKAGLHHQARTGSKNTSKYPGVIWRRRGLRDGESTSEESVREIETELESLFSRAIHSLPPGMVEGRGIPLSPVNHSEHLSSFHILVTAATW